MEPLAYQWYDWLTNGTNCTIGRANGTIGITIGTNGITVGTIDKTLNDIGIPLVRLGNPEHTPCKYWNLLLYILLRGPGDLTVVKVTFQYWISDLYPEDEDEDESFRPWVISPWVVSPVSCSPLFGGSFRPYFCTRPVGLR